MKKKHLIPLIFILITVVLEILPYGAVLRFGLDGGKTVEEFYSYFSLTPYGYANFLPFIVSVLTCVLLVLSFIVLIKDNQKLKRAVGIICIAVFVLATVSFALFNLTITAALIAVMLLGASVGARLAYKS